VKEAIRILKFKCVFSKRIMACMGAMVFAIALFAGQAQAFQVKTANPEVKMNFDNTLTYSTMYRLGAQDPELLAVETPNSDDGDRNFDKGFVMNRLDLYSEFDVSYKKFGVRFSGAGYYDTAYSGKNDNDSPATVNHDTSVVPYNEFTDETKELHGQYFELLEAFAFGSLYFGDSELSFKAGQYSLWWGTSFFLGDNGVAAGMSPVNVSKVATLPNAQMKDVTLPIPQVSANLQVSEPLSFGAYYQLKWENVRLWGSGSYFSPVDLLIEGGDRIIVGPDGQTAFFARTADAEPDDSGQYGFQVQYQSPWGIDFGAYAQNYHSRGPTVIAHPIEGTYHLYYPEDIKSYAVSANTSIGVWTISGEVTYRPNAPLVSNVAVFPNFGPFVDMNHEDDIVARGETLHANLNFFMPGLPSMLFFDTADFIYEIGWNNLLSVTEHEELLDPAVKNDTGVKMKMVFEPKWFQFLPAFDLTMPMGFEYTLEGNDQVQDMGPDNGGFWTVGIGGTYNNKTSLYFTYVNYFGDVKYQSIADRDYVGFFIRRAF
jgi:hypothetical protein